MNTEKLQKKYYIDRILEGDEPGTKCIHRLEISNEELLLLKISFNIQFFPFEFKMTTVNDYHYTHYLIYCAKATNEEMYQKLHRSKL